MVEVAAHMTENLIPAIPIRQWVISFPKRIRHYLRTEAILQKVLRIVANEIRKRVVSCRPEVVNPHFGAISFIQRFGNTLNEHPHFHFIVADGVFEKNGESFDFHEIVLTPDDVADTQDEIQLSVLGLLRRKGWIEKEEVEKMLSYENSGFSLDAKVKILPWDREGLERLIRYCARPPFASENLRWNGPMLVYHLPKPCHTGKTFIQLDPIEFIDKIAALIPPARKHRHHYHGVFAPNAPLRRLVSKSAIQVPSNLTNPDLQKIVNKTSKISLNWAKLIARIYEVNPLQCSCGKEMRIVKFVTHSTEIWQILSGMGWPSVAPEFDEPQDLVEWNISQLTVETEDGFPVYEENREHGPDPPQCASIEWESCVDPPHWEDTNYIIYD